MSHTNIRTINSVEINNSGPFRVGDQLTSGTTGQVLKSQGDSVSPEWSDDTDTTYQGSSTINIDTGTTPDTINVLKVPNALTFTGSSTGTFDGSSALSINLTDSDTTYQGSSTINIDTTTDPDTINVLKVPNVMTASSNIIFNNTVNGAYQTTYDGSQPISIRSIDTTYTGTVPIAVSAGNAISLDYDGDTLDLDGADLAVAKVPNVMTAGTNIIFNNTDDGASASSYDGSEPITINAASSGTTYQGGTNISIDTSTTPDSINLDANIGLSMINPVTIIAFQQFSGVTALIGNSAANPTYGTDVTYLDLSSATNITSPYCFHKIYGTASTDFDSLTTSYAAGSILGALGSSIVAKQTALCVEVIVYNYAISSNRDTDMRLVDKGGSEWSVGTTEGGSGTGTIQTAREVHRADETDRQIVHQTWSITGLTIGNTYTFNPQAKTSATSNFLAAGGSYPDAFFRGYYLPS